MYNVLKTRISAGGYKLTEIQHKVKKLFVYDDLTEEQMDELLLLASGGVSTDAERPETLQMIQSLASQIEALEVRVKALEGNDDGGEEPIPYAEWKPWDGISNDYQKGAIVSCNGVLWESVFEGQNVWMPGNPGTEAMWVKYNPKEEE